jgi:hypothetical protein
MSEALPNFERLLREALAPVEPPADLTNRLENTLTSITELAAEELEAWELSAMRDPRNWVRPAALVLLRARRRAHDGGPSGGLIAVRWPIFDRSAERAIRDLGRDTRKLLGDR